MNFEFWILNFELLGQVGRKKCYPSLILRLSFAYPSLILRSRFAGENFEFWILNWQIPKINYWLLTNNHYFYIFATSYKSQLWEHFDEFIQCYQRDDRSKRQETYSAEPPQGRWRKYTYEEIPLSELYSYRGKSGKYKWSYCTTKKDNRKWVVKKLLKISCGLP